MTSETSSKPAESRRRRVLVVDDEPVILDATRRILGSEGFDVITEPNAESGLTALAAQTPDLAVVDLKLPGMSGLEFVEAIRVTRPEMPIIVTTGVSSLGQAVRAIEKGAFDFLPKPFTFEELLGPVNRAARFSELPYGRMSLSDPQESGQQIGQRRLLLGMLTWAEPSRDEGFRIGVTRVFSSTAGESASISLPNVGDRVSQGGHVARIGTTDGRNHWVLSPLSGGVLKVNPNLEDKPDPIDDDPLGGGWIAVIDPSDLASEITHLQTPVESE